MKNATKHCLITATVLCGIGLILFAAIMTAYHWDFTRLNTEKTEIKEFEIGETFRNIVIQSETEDIRLVASENEKCRVVIRELENVECFAAVEGETLTVRLHDTRKWYQQIGFFFGTHSITVYLPEAEYAALSIEESTGDIEIPETFRFETVDCSLSTGDVSVSAAVSERLKIGTDTGAIRVENTSVGALDLSVSTGNITVSGVTCTGDITVGVSTGDTRMTDVTCGNLSTDGSTGYILLKNVVASAAILIERSTGDVRFDGSDAAELTVRTKTGSVTGTLLSPKVYIAKTSTGSVRVPESVTGGKCAVTTSTGDISLSERAE